MLITFNPEYSAGSTWERKSNFVKAKEVLKYLVQPWFFPWRFTDRYPLKFEMIQKVNQENQCEKKHWVVKRNASLIVALLLLGSCAMSFPLAPNYIELRFRLALLPLSIYMSAASFAGAIVAQQGMQMARKLT